MMVFLGPSSDLVLFSSLYRVLIERETLLITFQIGLQLLVVPSAAKYDLTYTAHPLPQHVNR